MKKRIFALISLIAVLATAMSLCISSVSVSAATMKNGRNFTEDVWFSYDDVSETEEYKIFDISAVEASDTTQGRLWGPRPWQGLEIRQEKTGAQETYLYMYDKGQDVAAKEAGDATDNTTGINYLYWGAEKNITASASSEDPMEVEIVFKKDGAGWDNGGAIWFRIALYGSNVTKATAEWTNEQFAEAGLAKVGDTNSGTAYNSGWYYTYVTAALNSDGSNGQYTTDEEGWSVLKAKVDVPEVYAGATRFCLQLKYSEGATEEVEDLGLKIKRVNLISTSTLGFDIHEATFDKQNPKNIEISANVASAERIEMFDADEVYIVQDGNYFIDGNKIVIKKDYLQTLSAGTHKVYIEVDGDQGSREEFTITVVDASAPAPSAEGGCGSVIATTSAILGTTLLAGAVILFKKKN